MSFNNATFYSLIIKIYTSVVGKAGTYLLQIAAINSLSLAIMTSTNFELDILLVDGACDSSTEITYYNIST
jgi:hypothetical protein